MIKYIHSSRIYTQYGLKSGLRKIKNKKISNILSSPDENGEIFEYEDNRVIPGIIDVHNHGYGGWSMTDPVTVNIFHGYLKACASIGITTVLPTTTKNSPAIEGIIEGMSTDCVGSKAYGIHSEGPFWARGGENTVGESWPDPSIEMTKDFIERAKGNLKVMAIAPELPGAHDVMKFLHENGVKVAACHTKANASQIREAMEDAGFDIVTHLCNGMQGIHHRDIGALGQYLLMDNLFYEIICDLNHVCADMLKLVFKIQPYNKFCLISDSNFISGMPAGIYNRYGKENISKENGLIVDRHGRICGSGKCVLYNMHQLTDVVGVPFEKVIEMASTNPARYLGIEGQTGSITPGKLADISVISDDYTCLATFVDGNKVYDCNSDLNIFNQEAMKLRIGDLPEEKV